MAKRWMCGLVASVSASWLAPVQAQPYPDPAPIYRPGPPPVGMAPAGATARPGNPGAPAAGGGGWPGYGAGPVPSSSGAGAAAPGGMPPPPPRYPMPMPPRDDCPDEGGFASVCKDFCCSIFDREYEAPNRDTITFGYLFLVREKLDHFTLAVQDPRTADDPDIPLRGAPVIADLRQLRPSSGSGLFAAWRWYNEDEVVELAGFWVPNHHEQRVIVDPGRVTSFFFNPPLGFEGNNTLWDNADAMVFTFSSTLANAELNYRCLVAAEDNLAFELLTGFRYLYLRERIGITTSDDNLRIAPDPTEVATYTVRTQNHLLTWQGGLGVHGRISDWLSLSWESKGAWGATRSDVDTDLVRGDGLVGRRGGRSKWHFGHIYDTGAYLDLNGSFWRVRFGYNLLWVLGVAPAQDHISYDLENTRGRTNFNGTVFFHGPTIQLDIAF